MPLYKEKVKFIEAIQYRVVEEIPCKYGISKKTNVSEIAKFMKLDYLREATSPNGTKEGRTYIPILTNIGTFDANIGDYILKDNVAGGFYPVNAEVFEHLYELAE